MYRAAMLGDDDDRDEATTDTPRLYDPALMPPEKVEAYQTAAAAHVRWRRETRQRLRLEDVMRLWAEGVLRGAGLAITHHPFVLVGGRDFRPATDQEIRW